MKFRNKNQNKFKIIYYANFLKIKTNWTNWSKINRKSKQNSTKNKPKLK